MICSARASLPQARSKDGSIKQDRWVSGAGCSCMSMCSSIPKSKGIVPRMRQPSAGFEDFRPVRSVYRQLTPLKGTSLDSVPILVRLDGLRSDSVMTERPPWLPRRVLQIVRQVRSLCNVRKPSRSEKGPEVIYFRALPLARRPTPWRYDPMASAASVTGPETEQVFQEVTSLVPSVRWSRRASSPRS